MERPQRRNAGARLRVARRRQPRRETRDVMREEGPGIAANPTARQESQTERERPYGSVPVNGIATTYGFTTSLLVTVTVPPPAPAGPVT